MHKNLSNEAIALTLRSFGYTYKRIGAMLKVTGVMAWKYCNRERAAKYARTYYARVQLNSHLSQRKKRKRDWIKQTKGTPQCPHSSASRNTP